MLQVNAIRTFAINAKDLAQAEEFYTRILGAEVVRRIDPNEEQLKRGRVKEVDVQVGEQSGMKIDNIRDHPEGKGYSLYVKDPDGNIWELWAAAA